MSHRLRLEDIQSLRGAPLTDDRAKSSFFNVPASCVPSSKPAPRLAKIEDQQLRYFLLKEKITSFDAFKPERNLQKQYKNLIISSSKERLVCLFMTDNFRNENVFCENYCDGKSHGLPFSRVELKDTSCMILMPKRSCVSRDVVFNESQFMSFEKEPSKEIECVLCSFPQEEKHEYSEGELELRCSTRNRAAPDGFREWVCFAQDKFDVPRAWKHSIIKPLHKAGDINTASNYRPISLLPVLSKILEKVISNQLSTYLDKSNLLHPNQYANRKHTSTQDALLNITEKICSDIDTKNVTLLLLLDLSKTFDSVEQKRLLQKISNLGIATQWFQSYLANRSHAVKLENTISLPIQNDFGVPQGSILGPLLLSIFINDFPSMPSNTRISMYADDVQIAMTSAPDKLSQKKSNAEILLKHVKSWYDQNGLKLNANKTHCVIFGSKNTIKKTPEFDFNVRN
ncbi:Reverse transcriptase domain [Trinorchestia longiramus]|nr:Reverse transcriptase domain [Trinorchestia longiramus]